MRLMPALLALVTSVACNRVEEPKQSADPERAQRAPEPSAPASATTEPVKEPVPSAKCVVETPAQAPPRASAATRCPPDPGPPVALPRTAIGFPDVRDAPQLSAEVAQTDAQRARGLMYRTELGEREAMLFSWSREEPRSFWMRNTCIPLDMLFLSADGTIVGILEQVPVLNETPRTVPCPAAHVLEVNAGFCRKYGIKAGMRVAL